MKKLICFKKKDVRKFLVDDIKRKKDTFKYQLGGKELANCYRIWYNRKYGSQEPFKDIDNKLFYIAMKGVGEFSVLRGQYVYFVGLVFDFKHNIRY